MRAAVRWTLQHGLPRAPMRGAARAGDPQARLIVDPSTQEDPFALHDEIRARGRVVRGRLTYITAPTRSFATCCAATTSGSGTSRPPFPVRSTTSTSGRWTRWSCIPLRPRPCSPWSRPSTPATAGRSPGCSPPAPWRRCARASRRPPRPSSTNWWPRGRRPQSTWCRGTPPCFRSPSSRRFSGSRPTSGPRSSPTGPSRHPAWTSACPGGSFARSTTRCAASTRGWAATCSDCASLQGRTC